MSQYPSRKIVEQLRDQYPEGCRVVLDSMNDVQAPEAGAEGTVIFVDDVGAIHVSWDNGSSLRIVFGEDQCHRV